MPPCATSTPRVRSPLAGLHVLHEHKKLVARCLDDGVEIAADHERRRLQMFFVRHLDDINTRHLDLGQVIGGFHRLVTRVFGNIDGPFSVRGDEADVERFHFADGVLLAEIRLGVEFVRAEGELFEVSREVIFRCGVSPVRNVRGVTTVSASRFHHRDPLPCLRSPRLQRHFLELVDRFLGIALFGLSRARRWRNARARRARWRGSG